MGPEVRGLRWQAHRLGGVKAVYWPLSAPHPPSSQSQVRTEMEEATQTDPQRQKGPA